MIEARSLHVRKKQDQIEQHIASSEHQPPLPALPPSLPPRIQDPTDPPQQPPSTE